MKGAVCGAYSQSFNSSLVAVQQLKKMPKSFFFVPFEVQTRFAMSIMNYFIAPLLRQTIEKM